MGEAEAVRPMHLRATRGCSPNWTPSRHRNSAPLRDGSRAVCWYAALAESRAPCAGECAISRTTFSFHKIPTRDLPHFFGVRHFDDEDLWARLPSR